MRSSIKLSIDCITDFPFIRALSAIWSMLVINILSLVNDTRIVNGFEVDRQTASPTYDRCVVILRDSSLSPLNIITVTNRHKMRDTKRSVYLVSDVLFLVRDVLRGSSLAICKCMFFFPALVFPTLIINLSLEATMSLPSSCETLQ